MSTWSARSQKSEIIQHVLTDDYAEQHTHDDLEFGRGEFKQWISVDCQARKGYLNVVGISDVVDNFTSFLEVQ